MKQETIKTGQLEINLGELARFLVDAKKHCYAGNGEELILPDGSKQLTFQKGNFHYTDNYSGWYQAPGSEIVRWQKEDGRRIWQMSYSGGMLEGFHGNVQLTKQTFGFLKECLLSVTPDNPFRGKRAEIIRKKIEDNTFSYQCDVETNYGNIKNFHGTEMIWTTKQDNIIFSQRFIGGLIIPK
jgi:hypothetical protein